MLVVHISKIAFQIQVGLNPTAFDSIKYSSSLRQLFKREQSLLKHEMSSLFASLVDALTKSRSLKH